MAVRKKKKVTTETTSNVNQSNLSIEDKKNATDEKIADVKGNMDNSSSFINGTNVDLSGVDKEIEDINANVKDYTSKINTPRYLNISGRSLEWNDDERNRLIDYIRSNSLGDASKILAAIDRGDITGADIDGALMGNISRALRRNTNLARAFGVNTGAVRQQNTAANIGSYFNDRISAINKDKEEAKTKAEAEAKAKAEKERKDRSFNMADLSGLIPSTYTSEYINSLEHNGRKDVALSILKELNRKAGLGDYSSDLHKGLTKEQYNNLKDYDNLSRLFEESFNAGLANGEKDNYESAEMADFIGKTGINLYPIFKTLGPKALAAKSEADLLHQADLQAQINAKIGVDPPQKKDQVREIEDPYSEAQLMNAALATGRTPEEIEDTRNRLTEDEREKYDSMLETISNFGDYDGYSWNFASTPTDDQYKDQAYINDINNYRLYDISNKLGNGYLSGDDVMGTNDYLIYKGIPYAEGEGIDELRKKLEGNDEELNTINDIISRGQSVYDSRFAGDITSDRMQINKLKNLAGWGDTDINTVAERTNQFGSPGNYRVFSRAKQGKAESVIYDPSTNKIYPITYEKGTDGTIYAVAVTPEGTKKIPLGVYNPGAKLSHSFVLSHRNGGKVNIAKVRRMQFGGKQLSARSEDEMAKIREHNQNVEHSALTTGSVKEAFKEGDYTGLTDRDYADLAALGLDITGLVASLIPGGSIAGAGLGTGATGAQLYSDIKNPQVSGWQAAGNAALGFGLDAVSAVPGIGIWAKTAKVGKMLRRSSSALKAALVAAGAFGGVKALDNIMSKGVNNANLDDWKMLLGGLQSLRVGVNAGAVRLGSNKVGEHTDIRMDDKTLRFDGEKKRSLAEAKQFVSDYKKARKKYKEASDDEARKAIVDKFNSTHNNVKVEGQEGNLEVEDFYEGFRTYRMPSLNSNKIYTPFSKYRTDYDHRSLKGPGNFWANVLRYSYGQKRAENMFGGRMASGSEPASTPTSEPTAGTKENTIGDTVGSVVGGLKKGASSVWNKARQFGSFVRESYSERGIPGVLNRRKAEQIANNRGGAAAEIKPEPITLKPGDALNGTTYKVGDKVKISETLSGGRVQDSEIKVLDYDPIAKMYEIEYEDGTTMYIKDGTFNALKSNYEARAKASVTKEPKVEEPETKKVEPTEEVKPEEGKVGDSKAVEEPSPTVKPEPEYVRSFTEGEEIKALTTEDGKQGYSTLKVISDEGEFVRVNDRGVEKRIKKFQLEGWDKEFNSNPDNSKLPEFKAKPKVEPEVKATAAEEKSLKEAEEAAKAAVEGGKKAASLGVNDKSKKKDVIEYLRTLGVSAKNKKYNKGDKESLLKNVEEAAKKKGLSAEDIEALRSLTTKHFRNGGRIVKASAGANTKSFISNMPNLVKPIGNAVKDVVTDYGNLGLGVSLWGNKKLYDLSKEAPRMPNLDNVHYSRLQEQGLGSVMPQITNVNASVNSQKPLYSDAKLNTSAQLATNSKALDATNKTLQALNQNNLAISEKNNQIANQEALQNADIAAQNAKNNYDYQNTLFNNEVAYKKSLYNSLSGRINELAYKKGQYNRDLYTLNITEGSNTISTDYAKAVSELNAKKKDAAIKAGYNDIASWYAGLTSAERAIWDAEEAKIKTNRLNAITALQKENMPLKYKSGGRMTLAEKKELAAYNAELKAQQKAVDNEVKARQSAAKDYNKRVIERAKEQQKMLEFMQKQLYKK